MPKRVKLRCSALPRAFHCIGSVVLPQIKRDTPESERGRLRHERLAKGGLGEEILRSMKLSLPPWKLAGQEMPLESDWLQGTADLVGLTDDGASVIIVDWKGSAEVEPPADNKQLYGYALLAAMKYLRPSAWLVVVHLDDDLNVLRAYAAFISAEAIQEFGAKVKRLSIERSSFDGEVTAGEWCRYCPCTLSCPAQVGLIRAMADETLAVAELGSYTVLEPRSIGVAWDTLKRAQLLLEHIEQSIKKLAEQYPVPLPNGKVLGPVEIARESFDGERSQELLAKQFGVTVGEVRVTKEAIKRTLAARADEAIVYLREHGAARTKLTTVIQEHKGNAGSCSGPNGDGDGSGDG